MENTTPQTPTVTPSPSPTLSKTDKIIMAASLLGTAFMGYLTYLHFKTTDGSLCDFGPNLSCEIVNKSVYSEVMGVPLAVLGLAYFITVGLLAYKKFLPHAYRIIGAFTLFSLVFGINLSLIELHDLGIICPFCEGSKLLMLVILTTVFVAEKRASRKLPVQWMAAAVVVGLAFVAVTRHLQAA